MNKELLYSITIPNYIRKVKLADSRRPKFFEVGESIPKKYNQGLLSGALQYRERTKKRPLCLFDTVTKEFVIKNPKVAGTERWEVINGQKIYSNVYHPAVRAKIMEEIHNFFIPYLTGLKIDKFPLYIECEIHDLTTDPISKNQKWDAFNRGFPYCKAFEDVLTKLGVIPDDNVDYVICPSHPIFFPISDAYGGTLESPKLVFKIYYITNGNNS